LPDPDSPTSATKLAPGDVQRDPVDRAHDPLRPAGDPVGQRPRNVMVEREVVDLEQMG